MQLPKKSGYNKLRPLCEKDAGLTIHKTVKAKGYFDPKGYSGVYEQIIFKKFQFIEFCTEKASNKAPFNEEGCWRVSKVARTGGQCSKAIDERLGRYVDDTYSKFLENSCFSVELIDKPRSKYSYITHSNSWNYKNKSSEFWRTESYIKDNVTNEIIAEYINYSFSARPGLDPYINCDDVDSKYVSMRDVVFVNSVISP
ncbi:MAG: hypothetical protein R3182_11990 [Draconibacterium sp.]|nr:hypothetical protein [Draconibacterium sp.]